MNQTNTFEADPFDTKTNKESRKHLGFCYEISMKMMKMSSPIKLEIGDIINTLLMRGQVS